MKKSNFPTLRRLIQNLWESTDFRAWTQRWEYYKWTV